MFPAQKSGRQCRCRVGTRRSGHFTVDYVPAWPATRQYGGSPHACAHGRSGQQRYEEEQLQRSIAALKRRAKALGFRVKPELAVASVNGPEVVSRECS